jgi:aerobic carbon-monoxide dehydrogenase medium subunit
MTALIGAPEQSGLRRPRVHRPSTWGEVLSLRASIPDAQVVAGATWVMRAALRGEKSPADVILLSGVEGLNEIHDGEFMSFGPMVTLEQAARATQGSADLAALYEAARQAATPALRRMITLGGSIGAEDFHASDIATAFTCLGAQVDRDQGLIRTISVPRSDRRSCHERLTWRSGGEYAVVSVSVSVDAARTDVHLALGSVEARPRRWTSVEQDLRGEQFTAERAEAVARQHLAELTAVSAPGIPAEYRLAVLPSTVARAVGRLA